MTSICAASGFPARATRRLTPLSRIGEFCRLRGAMSMIQTAALPARHDLKVMSLIGTGHFFSHFYILLLPPLFPLLKDAFGVGYVELGVAIAVLNGVTGLTRRRSASWSTGSARAAS